WEDCRFSPVVRDGEDGTRFAAGTLSIRRIRTATGENEQNDSPEEALVQHVQVLDTATGNSALSLTVAPAVMDGQNFALSPDGRMLAAVEGNAVRLDKPPEMSPDDRARSIAVKADAPNLKAPSGAGEAGAEPIYSASED